ncbi:snaclec anticoagulant protein subunit A-like [Haliotis rubra]|uniref:snaclec anticoagulant protein subunit A-like n=1 Tax=Haliotis rubra TaxID=36100 RepID=UPI001EE509CD|nr:snaclec anticoagulant protein subunit A-like [Haliotis rubra]
MTTILKDNTLIMGLTMVLVLYGIQLASLPPGVPVSSRGDCVSNCYLQRNCSSVFHDGSTNKCQLSAEVFLQQDFTSTPNNMQYLEWRRDDCDKGYTWYRSLGLCYKIYNSTETWFQANHTCNQDGGYLIKVDSTGINEFMNKISDYYSVFIWLGGVQDDLSGKWTWTDGSVISPAYWMDGQPSTESEKCIGVHKVSTNLIRRWNDFPCIFYHISMFVCQLPLKEKPYC